MTLFSQTHLLENDEVKGKLFQHKNIQNTPKYEII